MNTILVQLNQLFERIPRRYSPDNVKEIYDILNMYEDLLRVIETQPAYEKDIAFLFDALEPIRATIKKSADNKANKKTKDLFFDEASGNLKDTIEALKVIYH